MDVLMRAYTYFRLLCLVALAMGDIACGRGLHLLGTSAGNAGSGSGTGSSPAGPLFGSALSLNGSSSVRLDGSAGLAVGGTYTMEAFIRGSGANLFTNTIVSMVDNTASGYAAMQTDGAGHLAFNYVHSASACAGATTVFPGTTVLAPGTKYHIAVVATPTTAELFVNGIREAVGGSGALGCSVQHLYVGSNHAPAEFVTGLIDEVRWSNSQRYSGASFTVPTQPFVADGATIGLMHFDSTVSAFDAAGLLPSPTAVTVGSPSLVTTPFP